MIDLIKKYSGLNIVLTFHCSNQLFKWSYAFANSWPSAGLEFAKVFLDCKTNFVSQCLILKQNTIILKRNRVRSLSRLTNMNININSISPRILTRFSWSKFSIFFSQYSYKYSNLLKLAKDLKAKIALTSDYLDPKCQLLVLVSLEYEWFFLKTDAFFLFQMLDKICKLYGNPMTKTLRNIGEKTFVFSPILSNLRSLLNYQNIS